MTGQALITGAAKRLGRAMAMYLAGRGLDVAIHYNGSKKDAEQAVEEAQGLGVRAVALQADLTVEEDMQNLVPRAVDALGGPLTVLVNSASIFEHDTIETGTRESWDRHIESNLRAPFVLTQVFAAQAPDPIVGGEWDEPEAQALIVNMVDQRVRKLTPHFASYTIAKMGLWTMTQTAAQTFGPRVRVNAIGPGPTMQGVRQSREHFEHQRRNTIMKRGSDASDVTGALGYLMDAPSVTGQLICVDSGQHLGWQTPDMMVKE